MNGENTKNRNTEELLEIFDTLDGEKQALFQAYLRALAQEGDEERNAVHANN